MSSAIADSTNASSRLSDYIELCKIRIMSMVLVSMAVAGVAAATGSPNWALLLHALFGTAFVAFSSSVFNQLIERQFDGKMPRTSNRPVAAGRLGLLEGATFGLAMLLFGLAYLLITVNVETTFWAAATWILYVCVYTPMKRITAWNTFVGALPGALPIFVGWAAVSDGAIDRRAIWLFALLFVWQFPHFMAIAWIYKEQYAGAGFRMLSAQDPLGRRSGITAIAGAAAVLVLAAMQPFYGIATLLATALALALALWQLWISVRFFRNAHEDSARQLLRASLIFLPAHLIIITLSQFGIF